MPHYLLGNTAIVLPERSYGAHQSFMVGIEFKTLSDLKSAIRARRWYRSGDNPGQVYMKTCKLVAIVNGDYEKMAVLEVGIYHDI